MSFLEVCGVITLQIIIIVKPQQIGVHSSVKRSTKEAKNRPKKWTSIDGSLALQQSRYPYFEDSVYKICCKKGLAKTLGRKPDKQQRKSKTNNQILHTLNWCLQEYRTSHNKNQVSECFSLFKCSLTSRFSEAIWVRTRPETIFSFSPVYWPWRT